VAEYCRNCAAKLFGEKVAAKHYRGICKKGETYMELCEGCGDFVELDHTGWRVGTQVENDEVQQGFYAAASRAIKQLFCKRFSK
jgi:hypothetical protein